MQPTIKVFRLSFGWNWISLILGFIFIFRFRSDYQSAGYKKNRFLYGQRQFLCGLDNCWTASKDSKKEIIKMVISFLSPALFGIVLGMLIQKWLNLM